MRKTSRRFALLGGLLLLASAAAGCGGSDDGTAGGAVEKKKIKVATLPMVNDAPVAIALKEKLFEAEGLEVQAVPVAASTQALPGLKNGSIDVVFGNLATFLQAQDQGAMDVRIVAEGTTLTPKFMGVLVMPNSPIKTIGDLQDKKVTVHVLNNIQALTLNTIAKANNVDPKRIRYTQVIFPQMPAAMQKGDVDAIHTLEPFLTEATTKLGARLVVDGGQEPVTNLALDGYIATAEWARKNPKTAAAFQRALFKAQARATDRKVIEEVLPEFAKLDPQTARIMTMPGFPTSLNTARVQRLADLMHEQGVLKKKMDVKPLLINAS
ncbi:ABC transporter substrate-binding protein [Thermomonospora amylolytica]|uniref:ABC transporter substrate-binding protein n=1 Tax=Thermomonospora amylolytica TaxID=1411117 RepID=UPI00130070A8|nr:ABC transporter substrate-binding protein [Thermomonospora amylolytica]